jgi:hypothetical protein
MQHGSIARSAASDLPGFSEVPIEAPNSSGASCRSEEEERSSAFPPIKGANCRHGAACLMIAQRKKEPPPGERVGAAPEVAQSATAIRGEKTRWRVLGNSSFAHLVHSALTLRVGLGLYRGAAERELRSRPSVPGWVVSGPRVEAS